MISFVASKGGAGKSMLAINCAVAAFQQGKRVIVYDIDDQGTCEAWFGRRPDGGWNWEEGQEPRLVVSGLTSSYLVDDAIKFARARGYDIVILDTPGRDTPGISNAIRASDLVLMPSRPVLDDLRALPTTADMAKRLGKSFAFILTQTPAVTTAKGGRVREAALSVLRLGTLAPQPIVSRFAYHDAHGLGLGVTEYEPNGKAAGDINRLWDWITTKMEEPTP